MPLYQPGQSVGKYLIQQFLGNGQFGEVYQALDTALHEFKAIKLINSVNPQNLNRMLNEARMLSACRHEKIVHVNEANLIQVGTRMHLVIDLEYIAGGSLEKHILNKFISQGESVKFLCDILYGLEYAHTQNVIHRDIKPANILLDGNVAKLSDFGLATQLNLQVQVPVGGYFSHLAPEVIVNRASNEQSDVFAAGVTLFRVANNIVNWHARLNQIRNWANVAATGKLIRRVGYERFVSRKLKVIINKACHPDVNRRYSSPREFRQALEKLHVRHDWVRRTPSIWSSNNAEIKISGSRVFSLDFRENGRRKVSLCSKHNTNQAAVDKMFHLVGNTQFH